MPLPLVGIHLVLYRKQSVNHYVFDSLHDVSVHIDPVLLRQLQIRPRLFELSGVQPLLELLKSYGVALLIGAIILIFGLQALIGEVNILIFVIKTELLRTGSNISPPIKVYFVFAVHHAPDTDVEFSLFIE